jgi:hypothetical protein
MLGAEPQLAENECRERQIAQTTELLREKIFVERFRIDPVPCLADLHEPDGGRLEDEEIVKEIRIRIRLPAVAHTFGKSLRIVDRCNWFLPAGHGGASLERVFPGVIMQ